MTGCLTPNSPPHNIIVGSLLVVLILLAGTNFWLRKGGISRKTENFGNFIEKKQKL